MKFLALGVFIASILGRLCVSASPLNLTASHDILDHDAREILARATPVAPHFVVYADAYDGTTGPPSASALTVKSSAVSSCLLSLMLLFYDRAIMSCEYNLNQFN